MVLRYRSSSPVGRRQLVHFYNNQMQKQTQPSENIKKLAEVLTNVSKAYTAAAPVFHNYFKRIFDLSLRTDLMIKEKYIKTLYDDDALFRLVDETVRYRLGLTSREPNRSAFLYSMNDPYMLTETLDSVLYRIIYSAYPPEVLDEFRNFLNTYVHDERIVDLMLSKLESNAYQ